MSGPSAARARVAAARTASRPDLAELALLLVPGAALLADPPWLALGALTAWLIWRWRGSPPARERWLLGISGAVAAMVLGTAVAGDLLRSRAAVPSDASLAAEYRAYWDELQASSDLITRSPSWTARLSTRRRSSRPLRGWAGWPGSRACRA